MARELIREQTSKSISHMLEGFHKTGGTSTAVQYFVLAERREVKRTNPTAITREEIEAYSNAMADNLDSFGLATRNGSISRDT